MMPWSDPAAVVITRPVLIVATSLIGFLLVASIGPASAGRRVHAAYLFAICFAALAFVLSAVQSLAGSAATAIVDPELPSPDIPTNVAASQPQEPDEPFQPPPPPPPPEPLEPFEPSFPVPTPPSFPVPTPPALPVPDLPDLPEITGPDVADWPFTEAVDARKTAAADAVRGGAEALVAAGFLWAHAAGARRLIAREKTDA